MKTITINISSKDDDICLNLNFRPLKPVSNSIDSNETKVDILPSSEKTEKRKYVRKTSFLDAELVPDV